MSCLCRDTESKKCRSGSRKEREFFLWYEDMDTRRERLSTRRTLHLYTIDIDPMDEMVDDEPVITYEPSYDDMWDDEWWDDEWYSDDFYLPDYEYLKKEAWL